MTLQVVVVAMTVISALIAWYGGQRNQTQTVGFGVILLSIALLISLIARLG